MLVEKNKRGEIFMKIKRLGLVGVGNIMTNAHIPGYLECEDSKITAIADINSEALKSVGDQLSIPEELRFTDYHDMLKCGKIDAVDVATSNDVHVKIALDALESGFPVSIEKPIGMDFAESATLLKKSKETGLPVFVCFSWRYMPLPRYMKKLVDEGTIGRIYHIYIRYVKDSGLWKGRKLEWRFQEERASSGVLCDLGSHMFDMIRFFGEEFENIYCDRGTIVSRRPNLDGNGWGNVTTDDWCNVVIHTRNGIGATVEISRCSTNEKDFTEFYLIGEKGSLKFRSEWGVGRKLFLCAGEDFVTNTFREITPPEDFTTGGQSRSFIDLLQGNPDEYAATIEEGMLSQVAVDAAKLSSELGRKVTVKELYEQEGLDYNSVKYNKPQDFEINIENKRLENESK